MALVLDGSAGTIRTSTEDYLASIRRDIAKTSLQIAVETNRVAFNLSNSFIDQFESDSGLGSETNTDRDTTGEFLSSVGSLSQIAQGTGTTIGSMTEAGGIAAAFDGDTTQGSSEGARKVGGGSWGHYVGKNYGSGVTYAVTQMKVVNVTGEGLLNEGASNSEHRMRLEYSDNGSDWSTAWESIDSFTRQANIALGATATINSSSSATTNNISTAGAHQYWRMNIKGNNSNGANVAELEFWAKATNATGNVISTAQTASSNRTKVSGVILYKNSSGTATLGTDLKVYFTCNGGTNWTEATSYTAGSDFSTGVKTVYLGETTCTSGTDVRYKVEWANQVAGSKVTEVHGIGVNY